MVDLPREALISGFRLRFRNDPKSALNQRADWRFHDVRVERIETDCNENGVLDSCDVFACGSEDCDEDGYPDECEVNAVFAREGERYEVQPGAQAIAPADVDRDGDVDLIFGRTNCDFGCGVVSVLLNRGDGTFDYDRLLERTIEGWTRSIAAGDLDGDGDGDDDVVAAGYWVQVLKNNGRVGQDWEGFAESTGVLLTENLTQAVNIADLDNDGDLDVGAAVGETFGPGEAIFWLNDGNGAFEEAGGFSAALTTRVIEFAELNGDNWVDVAVYAQGDGVAVAINRGNDVNGEWLGFGDPTGWGFSEHDSLGMAAEDLTGDGLAEIVVGGTYTNSLHLLENAGIDGETGEWLGMLAEQLVPVPGEPLQVDIADFNRDGFPDVLYATSDNSNNDVAVVLNRGADDSGAWAGLGPVVRLGRLPPTARDARAADVDADGFPDAVVAIRGYGSGGGCCPQSSVEVVRQFPRTRATDCNNNAVLDACEIADGTLLDCDASGQPDICDPDCNANGVPDSCDLAGGSSGDCNGNAIPDECEADCNQNGVEDGCELASGVANDCNDNAVLDQCEVASGDERDCDANGALDVCELPFRVEFQTGLLRSVRDTWGRWLPWDVRMNDLPIPTSNVTMVLEAWPCNSSARVAALIPPSGFSQIIQLWGTGPCSTGPISGQATIDRALFEQLIITEGSRLRITSAFQVQFSFAYDVDPGTDCNHNGALDVCDLQARDCNANNLVDECEPDADGDGIPDDCDLCPGTTLPAGNFMIGLCDTGVLDRVFENGCTMTDLMAECGGNPRNHGQFVTCVERLAQDWKREKMITGAQFGAIVSCAAKSDARRGRRPIELDKSENPGK